MKSSQPMVEVYDARNEMEAQVIRSLLESFNIPCVLKSNAAHSVHAFTIDGLGEVKIMVLESQAAEARDLIMNGKQPMVGDGEEPPGETSPSPFKKGLP
ncbi:MAG: DUF2007 domain-containing protein [Dehalococcoidales bacterium]